MNTLYLILYIIAALLLLAAASSRVTTKFNLVAAGLFVWILVPLIQTIKAM